ncbi:MAG: hypothetical protein Q9227_001629 [Pyrenula ochraceoflavens]
MKLQGFSFSFLCLSVLIPGLAIAQERKYDDERRHAQLGHTQPFSGGGDPKVGPRMRSNKKNVLFILVDDQDKWMDSMDVMPKVKSLIGDKGITYNRHFCTTALCCPARVSILTGQCTQSNTNVTDVGGPNGGYHKFIEQGYNDNYLPKWLQKGGVNTYYLGKMFNGITVGNFRNPFPAANSLSLTLDPGMYNYLNNTWSHDGKDPYHSGGVHAIDAMTSRALAGIDEAVNAGKPFWMGVAPAVPHVGIGKGGSYNPIPQKKWKGAFSDKIVPRNLVGWIQNLPQLDQDQIKEGDELYRDRLRVIAGLDDMVETLINKLKSRGVLEDTYIFYTTDNGFHIGQHRLGPGKRCGIEEDVNIPMYLRGPDVAAGQPTDLVTTHTDLAPTFLQMFGLDPTEQEGLDGKPMPYRAADLAKKPQFESVNIEYWGKGKYGEDAENVHGPSATHTKPWYDKHSYRAIRVFGSSPNYSLFYSVWCTGDHELYDMITGHDQMSNLMLPKFSSTPITGITAPRKKLVQRLDALVQALKACKGEGCRDPWGRLHPQGDVHSLQDALAGKFDQFYASQPPVKYAECTQSYQVENEKPLNPIPFGAARMRRAGEEEDLFVL